MTNIYCHVVYGLWIIYINNLSKQKLIVISREKYETISLTHKRERYCIVYASDVYYYYYIYTCTCVFCNTPAFQYNYVRSIIIVVTKLNGLNCNFMFNILPITRIVRRALAQLSDFGVAHDETRFQFILAVRNVI